MNRRTLLRSLVLTGLASGLGAHDLAAGPAPLMAEYTLVIRNHRFNPGTLRVPAGTKFKVRVTNQDGTPSEFESSDFNREQIVLPGSTVTVFIGPLSKGRYRFFDDFHRRTADGVLIVE